MCSIKVEALWGSDSRLLWCSRNIHVSGALQNPVGLAAFEQRQMNNQRGGWRGTLVGLKKRVEKSEAAFCSARTLKSFCQQTHTHQCKDTLYLSFSLSSSLSPVFWLPLSSPSSSPWVCSRDPYRPPVLTTRLLSRLWYLLAERSTGYFGSISPATVAALIMATKPGLYDCSSDSHLFVIHSHYRFPNALSNVCTRGRLCCSSEKRKKKKTWNERECSVGFPKKSQATTLKTSSAKREASERSSLWTVCALSSSGEWHGATKKAIN